MSAKYTTIGTLTRKTAPMLVMMLCPITKKRDVHLDDYMHLD